MRGVGQVLDEADEMLNRGFAEDVEKLLSGMPQVLPDLLPEAFSLTQARAESTRLGSCGFPRFRPCSRQSSRQACAGTSA